MPDTTRVVKPDIEESARSSKLAIPLRLKLLGALLAALALPLAFAAFADAHPAREWLAARISAGPFGVPLYPLAVACVFVLGAAAGDALASRICARPVKKLLQWMREFRTANFERVLVVPPLPNDEIGELGREIGAATARFLQIAEQDKTMAEEKSLFLTIAAHQLRTPLTRLSWSIETLLDPAGSEESKRRLLPQLSAALKRMRLVVDHLLAGADIGEGRFGFVFERVDLAPLVEKLVEECKPIADDRGVSIELRREGPVPEVYADAERVSLALFDLVMNALDYTPRGGRVEVALAARGDRAEISVSDTGIGIPPHELPLIFTKFYRGKEARRMRPDGSGLGLYLARHIIAAHGSEIVVRSHEREGGSRFSFFLNAKKGAA